MSSFVDDAGSENEEKEGCNNGGWEHEADHVRAVETPSAVLAHPADQIWRRQQRRVRHPVNVEMDYKAPYVLFWLCFRTDANSPFHGTSPVNLCVVPVASRSITYPFPCILLDEFLECP